MSRSLHSLWLAALLPLAGCRSESPTPPPKTETPPVVSSADAGVTDAGVTAQAAPVIPTLPPVPSNEEVPKEHGRLAAGEPQKKLETVADTHFQGVRSWRLYVQLDKPLYQPGETLWVRTTEVRTPTLAGEEGPYAQHGFTYEVVSPRGSVVLSKRVQGDKGVAFNDFELAPELEGGEYTLRVSSDLGFQESRTFVVNTYEAPRFKKTLEFLRKAHGPGDTAAATVEVKSATGEPFAGRELTGILTLDGQELPRVKVKTDAKGAAVVAVPLPATIERGDALLTVLVQDAGITESITRRVPIIVQRLKLSLFPEGGDLVAGLPSRVYFSAETLLDKPADIEGVLVDDRGQAWTRFTSFHNGLGRFSFTPAPGRSYSVEVTKPAGVKERFPLPLVKEQGCTLRTFDDFKGEAERVAVGVHCTEARSVVLASVLREQRVASATAKVEPGVETVVHLAHPQRQGVARLTLFNEALEPLAERLVYRHWRQDLRIQVTPDKASYTPRGEVVLTVETKDAAGKPVAAELGMAVVDDTVLSFADDKTGHLLARTYLEPELPGKVEEPNFYFRQDEPKAPVALELLLGTRGWRRFEWQLVLNPRPPPLPTAAASVPMAPMAQAMPEGEMAPKQERRKGAGPPRPAPLRQVQKRAEAMPAAPPPPADKKVARADRAPARGRLEARKPMMAAEAPAERDFDDAAQGIAMDEAVAFQWAPVRVFPVPDYPKNYSGPRTDFRETIYWNPSVKTDAQGRAQVRFPVSDAVTSFRVTTEGLAAGLAGHQETVLSSKLPFFLDVKLPLEVSQGDRINLPLTLKNETQEKLSVSLTSSLGAGVTLLENPVASAQALEASAGRSFDFPVTVGQQPGEVAVSFRAEAAGLSDEFKRTLRVVPLGFPRNESRSGTVGAKNAALAFNLQGATPGSVRARVTLYPTPLATVVSGLDSILQQPYGCFEQASSSNYPNVMVLSYLRERNLAEPELLGRASSLLDAGYKKLAPYETPTKGYEWFGGSPGHEALTAYGLMEFADMRAVYPEVDEGMVKRTAEWLLARRDGKGGFQRNAQALDSFGAASPEVTNAYIVWALTEAGRKDVAAELAAVTRQAQASTDPYVVALAAKAQLNVNPGSQEARALVKQLVSLQQKDGRFHGTTHSITRSGGQSLDVETTALATLALVAAGGMPGPVRSAVEWMMSARQGPGGFGSTQATILALKALLAYDKASRQVEVGGTVVVRVNGKEVGRQRFDKGRQEPIVLEGFDSALKAGENSLELVLDGGELPYTVSVDYTTASPASSPEAPVTLTTTLAKEAVKMGETVRLTATVDNPKEAGLPMTLVRMGLPGGLTFQTWQLKELVEKKAVDFYETRPREVILYFRALPPKAHKELALDLVATVPGQYTGPASSAYLYYTAEHRAWASPVQVRVER